MSYTELNPRCSLCNHKIGDGELDYKGIYPVHKDKQICKDNIIIRLIEVEARLRKLDDINDKQRKI